MSEIWTCARCNKVVGKVIAGAARMVEWDTDGLCVLCNVTDYDALKTFGHSPQKAAEIALDAKRGDDHARRWVNIARQGILP